MSRHSSANKGRGSRRAIESYELLDVRTRKPRAYPGRPMEEVIWLNKAVVTNATSKKTKKRRRPADSPLPSAMKIYEPKIQSYYRPAIETLFSEDSVCGTEWCVRTNETITALIKKRAAGGDGSERFMRLSAALEFLNRSGLTAAAKTIYNLFVDCMEGMFNARTRTLLKFLMDETTVSVLKYVKQTPSLHCHVDNVGGGRGPIVTVNIGPRVYYDLIPVFFTEREMRTRGPIRVRVESGDAVAMDGEMRYAWQHCIPGGYSVPENPFKYTVKFVLPVFGKNQTADRLDFFGVSVPVSMN